MIIGFTQKGKNTGWNAKIVVLKKKTLQLYFKTFIEKIIQLTWLFSRADVYRVER